jgi:hypothetical protein
MICGGRSVSDKKEIDRKVRLNIFDGIEMEGIYYGGGPSAPLMLRTSRTKKT